MDEVRLIEVKEEILADNQGVAERVRSRLQEAGVTLLNLMASPGAGKTSLILATARTLQPRCRVGVIEADLAAMVDAEIMAAAGLPVVQLRTGGMCHVDATMVERSLEALPLENLDLVILENVGNLVCPAEFDTGAHLDAMILSVPEGDDKPLKYPLIFTCAQALVLNKTDYLADSNFDRDAFFDRVRQLNAEIQCFELSCKTGEGLSPWVDYLNDTVML